MAGMSPVGSTWRVGGKVLHTCPGRRAGSAALESTLPMSAIRRVGRLGVQSDLFFYIFLFLLWSDVSEAPSAISKVRPQYWRDEIDPLYLDSTNIYGLVLT